MLRFHQGVFRHLWNLISFFRPFFINLVDLVLEVRADICDFGGTLLELLLFLPESFLYLIDPGYGLCAQIRGTLEGRGFEYLLNSRFQVQLDIE